ncbi:MAG: acyl carrier protein [Candidatus Omnitrophica bacterium]|nr:acyl carrier protein [Candidatus Omnitrophota bacterium]
MDNLEKEIIKIITQVAKLSERIDIKKEFSDLDIDSFSLIEIIFAIENKYNITIAEDNFNVKNSEELIKLVRDILNSNG